MHRTTLITLACTLIFLTNGNQLSAQFKIKEQLDEVTISYKWKKTGLFGKDDPPRLILKIDNENKYRMMISFRVNYFWKAAMAASSQRVEYCVKSGRKIRGKMWDLVFSAGRFTEEQILDENFLWEISELEIVKDADCKSRLNIRIKPEMQEVSPGV